MRRPAGVLRIVLVAAVAFGAGYAAGARFTKPLPPGVEGGTGVSSVESAAAGAIVKGLSNLQIRGSPFEPRKNEKSP